MNWDHVKTTPPARPEPPPPTLIDLCWRMVGPSRKILSAGVYRNGDVLEVRAGFGEDDFLRSERVKSIGEGHSRCEEWRQALLAQGGWRQVSE